MNNVNNTPGITGYTWNLGTDNGWLYNGQTANAAIQTATNTINLVPVCGLTQKNFNVTIAANGSNYVSNTSTVNITIPNLAINGPYSVCESSEYTIPNFPQDGTGVNWSLSDPYVGSLSTSGANVIVSTISGKGDIASLKAEITLPNGRGTFQISKSIAIGLRIKSTRGLCNGLVQSYYLEAIPAVNGTNYSWTVDYVSSGSTIFIQNPTGGSTYVDVKGGGTVKLTYKNACGVTKTDRVTLYSTCR